MNVSLAGTDATHADHIETIKSRMYVGLQNGCHFVPGELGMGLVEGYDNMGYPMSKPHLRAELETDLKRICEGTKDPKVVLTEQLAKYKEVFRMALQQVKCDVVADAFLFVHNDFDTCLQAGKVELYMCSAVFATTDEIMVMGLVDYSLQTVTERGILQTCSLLSIK